MSKVIHIEVKCCGECPFIDYDPVHQDDIYYCGHPESLGKGREICKPGVNEQFHVDCPLQDKKESPDVPLTVVTGIGTRKLDLD